jgi:hypothetical protein
LWRNARGGGTNGLVRHHFTSRSITRRTVGGSAHTPQSLLVAWEWKAS